MPDISMCDQRECPKRLTCYRFMAIPNPYRQSYVTMEFDEDGCDYYCKIQPGDRVRDVGVEE